MQSGMDLIHYILCIWSPSGYVIEKRDISHGGGWVPAVNWVDPKTTHATVPRLLEGTQYEFRVRAENMQGQGEPLVSDKPVTAKPSAGEYAYLSYILATEKIILKW